MLVGMTRFELATTRPPDVYSNLAELHPELIKIQNFAKIAIFLSFRMYTTSSN